MNKYTDYIKSFWICLTSVGLTSELEDKDKKYVKFTNVVAVLTAISVFIYIPFSLLQGYYTLAIVQSIDVLCVLTVLWLNHTGHHKIARHVYILVINSFVLLNSCFIGYESRVHDFFYIAYIVPFLLFSVKDYRNIVIGVLISIIFFNVYEAIYPMFKQYNLDEHTQHVIANINLWMKFVLFGVAIYILSYYNQTTEAELATTNKKLQEQAIELQRSNSDLEQFAAIISHDLKAPVRNVSSFMGLLIRRYGKTLAPDALSFAELSRDSTDRMARQIDDILAYSKVGRNLPTAGAVNVNTMIQTIEIELGQKAYDKKAEIIIEQHLPILRNVHTSMIHHIFQNLISNAIKFNTHEKPEVRINCIVSAHEYVFLIKDNGIGIHAEYRDQLFQMFRRLHTEKEFEGTGIGLAVCKKIVDYYGGNIWLESKPGQGTCFYFSIPRLAQEPSQVYSLKYSDINYTQAVSVYS
jgi:signal transduction histidine kinase